MSIKPPAKWCARSLGKAIGDRLTSSSTPLRLQQNRLLQFNQEWAQNAKKQRRDPMGLINIYERNRGCVRD